MHPMTMEFKITGTAPIGFSAPVRTEKQHLEDHAAFEERTWREKMHVTKEGEVYIPCMALKNMLTEASKYAGEKIKGKGNRTYTKLFEAGIMVVQDVGLGIQADDVLPRKQFVPSDGVRGGGKRVWKHFPVINPPWSGTVEVIVLDPLLQDNYDRVIQYMEDGGGFIGLGWFRPSRNGNFGRFTSECLTHKAKK